MSFIRLCVCVFFLNNFWFFAEKCVKIAPFIFMRGSVIPTQTNKHTHTHTQTNRQCEWQTFDVKVLGEQLERYKIEKQKKNEQKSVKIKKKVKRTFGRMLSILYDILTCCISIADLLTGALNFVLFCFFVCFFCIKYITWFNFARKTKTNTKLKKKIF